MIQKFLRFGRRKNIQKEDFIIFGLTPISKKSEKTYLAASVPIVFGPPMGTCIPGEEFALRFCEEIYKVCGNLYLIPGTDTLVLNYNSFCRFVSSSDFIVSTIVDDLDITKQSALEQAKIFFEGKNVVVQATGIQGKVYKVGSYLQSASSAVLVTRTLAYARLAGVNGLRVLKAEPMLAIALPTTGAIFFYGCAAIAGNHTVGRVCASTGDICATPMKGVEIMWNSYVTPACQKIFGFPVILNMTQIFKTSFGYTPREIASYIKFSLSIVG